MRADGPHVSSGDAALRNPITGIAGCCARAASGHARRAAEQRDELAPSSLPDASRESFRNEKG